MKNRYKMIVLFDRDLNINFNLNLVDKLKVKSLFSDSMLKCEYWGFNEEDEYNLPYYEFGMIGDFNFYTYKNKTRLFSGEGFLTGYQKNNPSNLQLFSVHNFNFDTHTIKDSNYNPELVIDKRPNTMYDFAQMIDSYISNIFEEFTELQIEHYEQYSRVKELPELKENCNELPF